MCGNPLVQHDPAVDMRSQIGIVRDEDHRPGFFLAAQAAENRLAHSGMHVVEDAFENEELRASQDRPRHQDAHDVRGREDFAGGSHMRFQALGEGIDFLFEFGEAQGPSDVAIGNVVSSEHDVFFQRAFKQRELRIQDESSEPIDGVQVQVPEIDAVVADDAGGGGFEPPEHAGQRSFCHRLPAVRTCVFRPWGRASTSSSSSVKRRAHRTSL